MSYLVSLLILSISLSPRIPLPIQIPFRRFDLRIEDLILLFLFCALLSRLFKRGSIYVSSLFKPAFIYFIIVCITSVIALTTLPLNGIRTIFYIIKEMEYFIVFLVVINFIRTRFQLQFALKTLMIAGFINILWVGYQVVIDNATPLLLIRAENLYEHPTLLTSYGPTLIGEASPFATGTLFMIMFLLSISYLIFVKWKWTYAILGGGSLTSLVLSASRVSIFGVFVGLVVFLSLAHKKIQKTVVVGTGIMVFFVALFILSTIGNIHVITRVLDKDRWERSLNVRKQEIWSPLLPKAGQRFISGWGKGSIGFLPELRVKLKGYEKLGFGDEAHNNYLKLLLETGIFGLMAFVWLLYKIVNLMLNMCHQATNSTSKVIASSALAVTITLIIGALVHDVFKPVIANELWWLLIGLAVADWKINTKNECSLP